MATLHHNITGDLDQELIAPGNNITVSKVSITNISASNTVNVSLYIEKKLLGKFHLLSKVPIPPYTTLLYDDAIKFDNGPDQFGLYIGLTGTSPMVDVIIN